MLDKLRASRKELQEDLRCKVASEKVDCGCRLMTSSRTPVHKRGKTQVTDFSRLILSHSLSAPDLGVLMGEGGSTISPFSAAAALRLSPSVSGLGSP